MKFLQIGLLMVAVLGLSVSPLWAQTKATPPVKSPAKQATAALAPAKAEHVAMAPAPVVVSKTAPATAGWYYLPAGWYFLAPGGPDAAAFLSAVGANAPAPAKPILLPSTPNSPPAAQASSPSQPGTVRAAAMPTSPAPAPAPARTPTRVVPRRSTSSYYNSAFSGPETGNHSTSGSLGSLR